MTETGRWPDRRQGVGFAVMGEVFAFLDFLGPSEFLIVAVVAVLLYGERLPEVARSWGKKFTELKKSVQGIREEFEAAARDVQTTVHRSIDIEPLVDREEATAPKFEPPPSEPPSLAHEAQKLSS